MDNVLITLDRNVCVVCDDTYLEVLYVTSPFPIYMGTTTEYDDQCVEQSWGICRTCGTVQLTKIIKPEILYAHNHSPGTVGVTWEKHHKAFAEFVLTNVPGNAILEIGAGNTILAGIIASQTKEPINYFVADPNVNTSNPDIIILPLMWSADIDPEQIPEVSAIIHSHTMEHLNHVTKELTKMAQCLPEGGLICFSVPVIDKFLERGWTNGLSFEHNYLTTRSNIDTIVETAGFTIVDTEAFSDNNIFVAARKLTGTPHPPIIVNEYSRNKKLFLAYIDKLCADVELIDSELNKQSGPRFIFGAHLFTQMLVCNGLTGAKFLCILDNDTNKTGQRLYGTSLMVDSPEVIRKLHEPIVVVRAAQYTDEIVKALTEINPTVVVI